MKLEPHWTAEIFPLNKTDIERLAEDIRANGQREPILIFKGQILDGRTRLAACKAAEVEPRFKEYEPANGEPTDDELLALSWSLNEARRHLSTSQRACAAAEVAERMPETRGRKAKGNSAKSCTIADMIERLEVNRESVRQARVLFNKAPDLFAEVKANGLAVDAAFRQWEERSGKEADLKKRVEEVRAVAPALAEDVEQGRMTFDQAVQRVAAERTARETAKMKAEADQKAKLDRLAHTYAGLLASVDTLLEVGGLFSDQDFEDAINDRHGWQCERDLKRSEEAGEVLKRVQRLARKSLKA